MPTPLRSISIPLFITVASGCLGTIARTLREHKLKFRRPLVVSESRLLDLGGRVVVDAFDTAQLFEFQSNTIADGDRLAQHIRDMGNDLVVSIGGGRIVDLGKYAATHAQVDYISVPTSPSNDGIASPVAVMEDADGHTKSLGVNMPIGIVVDLDILGSAPDQNIRSGVGELISNFSAIADWRLAYREGKELMDDFAASISFSSAELIFETCRGGAIDIHETHFLEKLVHGLILSGIAMNVAGSSRPCSGGEHEISHAIDQLYPRTSLHGLQVAYGTLLTTFLRKESIDELLDFCSLAQLPVTHEELGLTREQLLQVLMTAPATRPDRFTILEHVGMTPANVEQLINEYTDYVTRYRTT